MTSSASGKRQNLWKNGRRKSKFIGNVIGKSGVVISQVRQQTGAKIKVEDSVPGCFERVVTFVGCEEKAVVSKKEIENDGVEEEDDDENENENDDDGVKESEENDEGKEADLSREVKVERNVSSAQKALLTTFDKMIEGEKEAMDKWDDKTHRTSLKLVVFGSQADFLKRIDGEAFEKMALESGARICFLPNNERPSCISESDEIVQIDGAIDEIKKAVVSVTHQLLENPPQTSELSQQKNPRHPFSSADQTYNPKESASDRNRMAKMPNDTIKMSFRLLCPEYKAGAVIGRGGSVVKGLQQDTGCEIDVADRQVDADERIILISGPAHPDDRISPIQDGVLQVHARIIKSPPESKEQTVTARLLVPSSQISALLGKGGTILAEIRKVSGTQVHILGKEQLPKRVSLSDDLVQVNGDFESVQEALLHITGQLQRQFFHSHGERRGSLQGVFLPPPHGVSYISDEPSPFMHNIQRLGVPLHILERNSSPVPQRPERLVNGVVHMGLDYVGDPLRRLPGGIHSAIITNTTVEVVVPSSVIPSIYGEGGGCLQQIRQISDATIIIADPKPGSTETMIKISGTPEQTNAAQSLIQAFVIIESQPS